jgi:hypothetical protein
LTAGGAHFCSTISAPGMYVRITMKNKPLYVLTPDLQFQRFQNYDEIEEIVGMSKPLIVARKLHFFGNQYLYSFRDIINGF